MGSKWVKWLDASLKHDLMEVFGERRNGIERAIGIWRRRSKKFVFLIFFFIFIYAIIDLVKNLGKTNF